MNEEVLEIWKTSIRGIAERALDVEGDFVECGSYLGVSSKVLAEVCKTHLHLFDSWEGVSELAVVDNPIYKTLNWNTDIENIKNNLSEFSNISFYKGWFPKKFIEIENKKISLLHLDCSLYEPTKISLEYMWDKMSVGGYVICNTHEGISTGPEAATRDFFKNKRELITLPLGILVAIK